MNCYLYKYNLYYKLSQQWKIIVLAILKHNIIIESFSVRSSPMKTIFTDFKKLFVTSNVIKL